MTEQTAISPLETRFASFLHDFDKVPSENIPDGAFLEMITVEMVERTPAELKGKLKSTGLHLMKNAQSDLHNVLVPVENKKPFGRHGIDVIELGHKSRDEREALQQELKKIMAKDCAAGAMLLCFPETADEDMIVVGDSIIEIKAQRQAVENGTYQAGVHLGRPVDYEKAANEDSLAKALSIRLLPLLERRYTVSDSHEKVLLYEMKETFNAYPATLDNARILVQLGFYKGGFCDPHIPQAIGGYLRGFQKPHDPVVSWEGMPNKDNFWDQKARQEIMNWFLVATTSLPQEGVRDVWDIINTELGAYQIASAFAGLHEAIEPLPNIKNVLTPPQFNFLKNKYNEYKDNGPSGFSGEKSEVTITGTRRQVSSREVFSDYSHVIRSEDKTFFASLFK